MIYDDGTMDVRLATGAIARRRYTLTTSAGRFNCAGKYRFPMHAHEPELRPGERVCWVIGDDVPTLVEEPRDA